MNKNDISTPKTTLYKITVRLCICCMVLLLPFTISGCSLKKDERTVQLQQLLQPNETESLPVWRDVYSKSVQHDVYSPQGHVEFLP